MAPRDATIKAMSQVSGPVIAVGLVLSAVFIPCAFITGITGQFFRQFALTIAVSTLISAFNSLTLSPALSALLLRPREEEEAAHEVLPRLAFPVLGAWLGYVLLGPLCTQRFAAGLPPVWQENLSLWCNDVLGFLSSGPNSGIEMLGAIVAVILGMAVGRFLAKPINRILDWSFRRFNQGFNYCTRLYGRVVGMLLRISAVVLVVYCGLVALTWWGLTHTPRGFIPAQDKGYLLLNVQLPDAASLERTDAVMRRIEQIALDTKGVKHVLTIAGQSILLNANAPNFGAMYVMLDGFRERVAAGLSSDEIAAHLQTTLQAEIQDGLVNIFGAPPVDGLGTAGGFKIVIEDRGDNGLRALQKAAETIVTEGNATPGLQGLFCSFRADTPWLFLDIDRTQAKTMGVSMNEVFNTLQVYLGSYYVNDFNRFGRTWQVNVQADADYRKQAEDLKQLKVRNQTGDMVPLGTMASIRGISGPVMIQRYNMYPSAPINGASAPGVSSGEAIGLMERVAQQGLLHTMRTEWTELAMLQLQTGNTAMLVFVLAVVLVFLVLAAQYESWSLPLAVILVVPMCLLCSVAGVALAHMDINIFTQVGFVVLVGLACKNAILIVEFAKIQHESGASGRDATLAACQLRLRPIIMTSLAFIIGVIPLAISVGAGAEMRRTLGTAVFFGMLGVTLFGIFLTPVFYFVIQWIDARRRVK